MKNYEIYLNEVMRSSVLTLPESYLVVRGYLRAQVKRYFAKP